ncbi:MAG: pilus assembly protein TadG-related protein [Planctomycetota bacterium]
MKHSFACNHDDGGVSEPSRRGVVLAFTLVTMTVLLGFAAMTIDVGMMYSIRAELQRTADAAALAAVQDLREADPSTTELARRTVSEYVAHNPILNAQQALFDPHKSVVFGRALVNEAESRVDFTPGVTPPNAVRVPGCGSAAAHRRRYPRNAACAQLRTG